MRDALNRYSGESPPAAAELAASSSPLRSIGPWWRIIRRHRLLIAACTATLVGTTAYFTSRLAPTYEASASIRIEENQSRLTELGISKAETPTELPTEMEVLQSRALAESVVDSLGLQVELRAPANVSRQDVFSLIRASRGAPPGEYRLELQPDGHYDLWDRSIWDRSTGVSLRQVVPGTPTDVQGLHLQLASTATRYHSIDFAVSSFDRTVDAVKGALKVWRRNRDANVIDVTYKGRDPQLVRDVPNALALRFIVSRQSERHAEARGTAKFLREQIENLSANLRDAEDSLRTFRERQGVVSLPDEATSGVSRAGELEAKRNSIEADRVALAGLIRTIQDSTRADPSGAGLAYRNLIAFPTLLHDEALAGLLASISAVEDRRSELLSRRSPQDPDVQLLTARANQLSEQVRAMGVTYLRGLTNQVAALDAALAQSRQELDRIPQKELRFARLQREVRGSEEIVTQLQSRLQAAEIAAAVEDPSVRLVDAAVLPKVPSSPKPLLNLSLALMLGLGLGTAGAFLWEYRDQTARSRQDVLVATGVPVLGLLPHAPIPDGRTSMVPRLKSQLRVPAGPKSSRSSPRQRRHFPGGKSAMPALLLDRGNGFLPGREGYNRLATNLAFAGPAGMPKVLMVTSPLPGEGKTTVAVNLAITLAQSGGRVLLIDADLRRGIVARVLGLPQEPGLSEILLKSVPFRKATQEIPVSEMARLQVIACGKSVHNPPALLGAQVQSLLRSLRDEYESIIVDTPPVNLVADAAVVGAHSDGVIVVARAGVTDMLALSFAIDELRHVGAPLLGAVLNNIDFRRDAPYDGAYSYYERGDAYARQTS